MERHNFQNKMLDRASAAKVNRDRGVISYVDYRAKALTEWLLANTPKQAILHLVLDDVSTWVRSEKKFTNPTQPEGRSGGAEERGARESGAEEGVAKEGGAEDRPAQEHSEDNRSKHDSRKDRSKSYTTATQLNMLQHVFFRFGVGAIAHARLLAPATILPVANWATIHDRCASWSLWSSEGVGHKFLGSGLMAEAQKQTLRQLMSDVGTKCLIYLADSISANSALIRRTQRHFNSESR